MKVWPILVSLGTLLVAAVLQLSVAPRISLFGASPDFLLTAGLCLALVSTKAGGALAGFVSGLLIGALSGATLTIYVVSRTVTGFVLATAAPLNPTLRTGPLLVATASLVSGLMVFFLAPRPDIAQTLGATILAAAYNGVIAVPLYAMARKIYPTEDR